MSNRRTGVLPDALHLTRNQNTFQRHLAVSSSLPVRGEIFGRYERGENSCLQLRIISNFKLNDVFGKSTFAIITQLLKYSRGTFDVEASVYDRCPMPIIHIQEAVEYISPMNRRKT